jgi:hypothetical protein
MAVAIEATGYRLQASGSEFQKQRFALRLFRF